MTLINNYKQKCPVARINIDCPFFRDTTDAFCIDDPAHDLVIGNIEGSKLVLKKASDAKLADIRRRVESGSVTKSRSFSSGETKFIRRNGLIYRHFKKKA